MNTCYGNLKFGKKGWNMNKNFFVLQYIVSFLTNNFFYQKTLVFYKKIKIIFVLTLWMPAVQPTLKAK